MEGFTANFDDSGSHDDSPIFVIAGWMASDEQWELLKKEWRQILDGQGVTVFHMKEFAHGKGDFEKLSEVNRRDLLRNLVDCLLGRVAVGVFGAIHLPSYHEIMKENPSRRKYSGIRSLWLACLL